MCWEYKQRENLVTERAWAGKEWTSRRSFSRQLELLISSFEHSRKTGALGGCVAKCTRLPVPAHTRFVFFIAFLHPGPSIHE